MLTTLTLLSICTLAYTQTCPKFPVVDLGYAKHGPVVVNNTIANNISYATYANIRFAQPPIGDLRFRKPQTPPPMNATIQNSTWGLNATDCLISVPPELEIAPGLGGASWGSEDCLFLDVKVPEGAQGTNLPVLHWLYGGGYILGSKDWAGDPAGLFETMSADQKFITVSSNYRLGALGWMSSDGVDMDKNIGIWDGLAALEWTKEYIELFGGNPNDITVIGESAGGGIIQHLLTAYGGQGEVPFNRAIITSPGYHAHVNRSSDMTYIYDLFLNSTNCSDISCLRSLPTDKIAAANRDLLFNYPSQGWLGPGIGYGPIIDGDLVPDIPDRLMTQGKYQKSVKRVMTANMAMDGLFATVLTPTTYNESLSYYMRTPTSSAIEAVQSLYPANATDAFNLIAQDIVFACHAYTTAKTWSTDAYRYSMSIPPAMHGQDQYYYFYIDGPLEETGVEFPGVARTMQEYFRDFILTGIFGGDGCERTAWPSYGSTGRWMNITSDAFELVFGEDYQAQRCELIAKLIIDPANGW